MSKLNEVLKELKELREKIPATEEKLKQLKAREKSLLDHELKDILEEMDTDNLETKDGYKLKLTTYVSASIADQVQAFEWLESEGYGDRIKESLIFAAGEMPKNVIEYLHDQGCNFDSSKGIHAQSLKKIIKDRFLAGESIPSDDVIKVNTYETVEVKAPS